MAEETKLCGNCKRQISANNFMMHEMHCRRHISVCQFCKEPIPKGELEVHIEESHAKIACSRCGVQVEKMHLEDHEENSCEKRPQKCLFCELEFPKSELKSHSEYCGSRTEPCNKCGQYIMLKDQLKHEETNCAFPPMKPANNNDRSTADAGFAGNHPFNIYGNSSNGAFLRNELERISGAQLPARDLDVPYVPLVTRKDSGSGGARTNVFNNGRIAKNVNTRAVKKSDLNKQREAVSSSQSSSAENDYDHLLAMHLAQDLNQEDDIDELIRRMEKPSSPILPTNPSFNSGLEMNRFSEDLSMFPCEFCGEPFIADDLVQHQSACSLDRISAMLPKLSASMNREDGLNNASENATVVTEKPPIIDNLRNFSAHEWLDDTDPVGAGEDDGSMLLPCEFCNELFPLDILVQHQAVCDSNASMTPRVQSPAVSKSIFPKKKTSLITHAKLTNRDRLEADLPNLTSRRHQAPPGLALMDDSDGDNDNSSGAIHRVLKPNIGVGASSGANIKQTLKRYGVESQPRNDYVTRHNNRIRNSKEENATSRRHLQVKQGAVSDSRTRSTLDNLLRDADESSHDLLANLASGGRKTEKNDVNNSRQKVVVTGKAVSSRGMPKSKPSSSSRDLNRDGHREPNSYSTQSSSTTNRNRARAADEPPFEIRTRLVDIEDRTSSQRPRPRANNVFGGQVRQQRRRSENS